MISICKPNNKKINDLTGDQMLKGRLNLAIYRE